MDAAVGVLRIVAVLFAVVGLAFSVYVRAVASIAASAAATAAAAAAADSLGGPRGWDCADSGDAWDDATAAAASAVVARTEQLSAVTPTQLRLRAVEGCVVLARVTVDAAGSRSWLHAAAVACHPASAAATLGWSVEPSC